MSDRIPLYIIGHNHLTYLRNTVDYFLRFPRASVSILDNASTYPPLLEWYATDCPVPVIRAQENHGPLLPWHNITTLYSSENRYYAVTDPDLDFSQVPMDMLEVLAEGLCRYPEVIKCGVSLEIDDLPEASPLCERVRAWESRFWQVRRDRMFFDADIDTTLALYPAEPRPWSYGPSLRSDRPYTARHLPWYITPQTATSEDFYYFRHRQPCCGHWSAVLKEHFDGVNREP